MSAIPPPHPGPIHTRASLAAELRHMGLEAGQCVIVHSSMKAIGGWVCGDALTVIDALMDVLTPAGTLVMPTQSADLTDPQYWVAPPVPPEWFSIIREQMPAYDPARTPTARMGIIPELFRSLPDVQRSAHPIASFAAWGAAAAQVIATHALDDMLGESSPLGKLYQMGALILLLGVGYGNCTALHLAEHRAEYVGKRRVPEGSPVWVNGARQWVEYSILDYDDSDFARIGAAYEAQHHPKRQGQVGAAECRLLPMRPLVDFGTAWMAAERT